ncbi:MAG: phenylalanine--tRNA ligase subunit beta [Oscillospiraceae bacterium]|nr:phenylalanine--tRNA ligase subunit beta [Oscillospiraceae bacterium]
MKLSRKWLNEFTVIDAPDREFCERMTLSGSKVEGYEIPGGEIDNVVVGRVDAIERHPDSDHLWVCQIDCGPRGKFQIVTGAQNVRQGDLVPAALDGSTLAGGVKINNGKLRGVESQGMLCSLGELGLTVNDYPYAIADGIFILQEDCVPGDDIKKVLGLDDTVVEFEITNNRPDCLSVRGLALEAAVTFGTPLKLHEPVVKGSGGRVEDYLSVEVRDPALCPRYTARVVRNIKIEPSPAWLRERLRASGVRPINNIVDITNYVMLEYGQPMHAFDRACVTGDKIIVRRANEGEKMETLDGGARDLTTDMIVIADEQRAIGLAGVMGGLNSEITENTKELVFESANFNGVSVRKTALALGMRTEASSRFEKSLDILATVPAVNRACELVEMLGAGEVVDGTIDVFPVPYEPTKLPLEVEHVNRLLGTELCREDMVKILEDLGFTFEGDVMTVPSWRADVVHYSDVAEEIARFYGFDKIEPTLPRGDVAEGGLTPKQAAERRVGTLMRGMGYSEMLTFAFISPTACDKIRMAADDPRRNMLLIQNPLGEDTSVMRTTMLPSLMECLKTNYSFRNKNVRLYELKKIYIPTGNVLPDEVKTLVFGGYDDKLDFFSFKGDVELLLDSLRVRGVMFEAVKDDPSWHPGRCAKILCEGKTLGIFGQVHPEVAANYDVGQEVWAAELNFEVMFDCRAGEPSYEPLPRFPAVFRDLAVVCSDDVTVASLGSCIAEAGGKLLKLVEFFNVYKGVPIPAGSKSVAFSLEFRDDARSLTDADIDPVLANILEKLEAKLGAKIR